MHGSSAYKHRPATRTKAASGFLAANRGHDTNSVPSRSFWGYLRHATPVTVRPESPLHHHKTNQFQFPTPDLENFLLYSSAPSRATTARRGFRCVIVSHARSRGILYTDGCTSPWCCASRVINSSGAIYFKCFAAPLSARPMLYITQDEL
jgi:hypothetical protein